MLKEALVHFRIGRKKTVITYMILGGIACVVVSLIPGGTERTGICISPPADKIIQWANGQFQLQTKF
jgi:hypothetical protein